MSHHCHGNLLLILKHDRGLAILLSVLVYTQHNTPTAEGEGEGEGRGRGGLSLTEEHYTRHTQGCIAPPPPEGLRVYIQSCKEVQ